MMLYRVIHYDGTTISTFKSQIIDVLCIASMEHWPIYEDGINKFGESAISVGFRIGGSKDQPLID